MEKVVIVTGGSYGIGEAIVKKFADLGHSVFNLDIAPPEKNYKNSEYIHCDVSSVNQIQQAVEQVIQSMGKIDIVISNAGKHYSASIENTTEEKYDEIMNLNVKGTFFLLQATLPMMKQQQKGVIVLMGSDQSFIGKSNSAVYGMSKGAIGQLTKSTAIDYAEFNIRVNCVCPGSIDTPLFRNAINNYSQRSGISLAEIEKDEAATQLLNRVGKPEEVAELVYFLSSDQAQYITGGLFPIDGGYTAR